MQNPVQTVIEITDAHIKFLQAKNGRGGPVISALEIIPIDGKTDAEIEALVLQIVQARSIKSESFLIVLPRRLSSVKRLRLPSVNDPEIQKMVPIQIGRMMPHVLEDLVYGYQTINKDHNGYSRIIAYIVHKDVCKRYFSLFLRAKVLPSKFILSSSGIVEWLSFQIDRGKVKASSCTLVLNFDLAHTELCFINARQLVYSRHINYGLKDLHGEKFAALLDQVDISIKMYDKEQLGPRIDNILTVSSIQKIEGAFEGMSRRFNVPVTGCSSLSGLEYSSPALSSAAEQFPGVSLTVCTGFLFTSSRSFVNLITRDIRQVKVAKVFKKQILQFAGMAVLTFILAVSIAGVDIFVKLAALNAVRSQIQRLDPGIKKALEKVKFVEAVDDYFIRRVIFSDLMMKLYRVSPPEVVFRVINLNRLGDVMVGGYGLSAAAINSLQNQLIDSAEFSDVLLQFTTKKMLYDKEVIEFKIQFKNKQQQ